MPKPAVSGNNQVLEDFLRRRKDRAIAIVLGVKEKDCDRELSAMNAQKLRKVILDQFNDLYNSALDVMGSLDNGEVVLNEQYLQKLDDLHEAVVKNGGST